MAQQGMIGSGYGQPSFWDKFWGLVTKGQTPADTRWEFAQRNAILNQALADQQFYNQNRLGLMNGGQIGSMNQNTPQAQMPTPAAQVPNAAMSQDVPGQAPLTGSALGPKFTPPSAAQLTQAQTASTQNAPEIQYAAQAQRAGLAGLLLNNDGSMRSYYELTQDPKIALMSTDPLVSKMIAPFLSAAEKLKPDYRVENGQIFNFNQADPLKGSRRMGTEFDKESGLYQDVDPATNQLIARVPQGYREALAGNIRSKGAADNEVFAGKESITTEELRKRGINETSQVNARNTHSSNNQIRVNGAGVKTLDMGTYTVAGTEAALRKYFENGDATGVRVGPKPAGGDGKINEYQYKAAGYAQRMMQANEDLGNLMKGGFNPTGASAVGRGVANILDNVGAGGIGNMIEGKDNQLFEQAKSNFITAVLRKESGATIGDAEYAREDRKYFPQFGDSAEVIAQKARARDMAIASMAKEGAPAMSAPMAGGVPQTPTYTPSAAAAQGRTKVVNGILYIFDGKGWKAAN